MQKTGTQVTKRQKSMQRKQTRLCTTAIGDDAAIYARVTKHLGNRSFLITIYDEKNNRHLTDVKAKVLSKRAPRITVPSVVNVTLADDADPDDTNAESRWGTKNWEILVPLDEKAVKQLKKDGRISEILASSSDISSETIKNVDGLAGKGLGSTLEAIDLGFEFDRGYEEETPETTTEKKEKVSKHKARVLIETDEIDVDAI